MVYACVPVEVIDDAKRKVFECGFIWIRLNDIKVEIFMLAF